MSRKSRFGARSSRRREIQGKERLRATICRRRLVFESLEDRRVLTCQTGTTNWGITEAANTVTVDLTDFDDILIGTTHALNGLDIRFALKDSVLGSVCWYSSFLSSSLTKITVNAKNGDDQVQLSQMGIVDFGGLINSDPAAEVNGGDGFDQIWGLFAKNLLKGDDDNDTIYGGSSNDDLHGGPHDDTIYGGLGDDQIKGNDGIDHLYGGGDNDNIKGDAFGDFLYGEGGNDTIYGGDHSDFISGGPGNDILYGDHGPPNPPPLPIYGNDVVEGNEGDDTIDGGPMSDVLWSNGPGWTSPGGTTGKGHPVGTTWTQAALTATTSAISKTEP